AHLRGMLAMGPLASAMTDTPACRPAAGNSMGIVSMCPLEKLRGHEAPISGHRLHDGLPGQLRSHDAPFERRMVPLQALDNLRDRGLAPELQRRAYARQPELDEPGGTHPSSFTPSS